jgi:homoserine kinase type II
MDEELVRVLGHYGLGSLRAIRQIERGFVDENWLVETELGRYFLKRRHPRRRQSARLIRAQHELIAWLRQAGFPAPAIVPTAAGETFLALDDEIYEVEEYIDGEPYDHGRGEHLDEAAVTLGRYHTLVEGFAPQALREQAELYCPASSHSLLVRLREAWQTEDAPDLSQLTRRLEAQIYRLAGRFNRHGELPQLIIHGDYYADNLLFDGDRIVGVVDFDKANWQPRVAEMAEALIYFASPRPGHLKHLVYPGFLEKERFFRFLENYARASTLDEHEVRALPDYICCIWLSISLMRLLEKDTQRPAQALEALQEVLALGTWVSVNAKQMIELGLAILTR